MGDLIWIKPHSRDGSVMEVSDEPRSKADGWACYVRLDTYAARLDAETTIGTTMNETSSKAK